MEEKRKVDREALKASLKQKYPEMPEPGTQAWVEFLKKLKEASPEDYRSALLLGGGITQALQKEIARSQRRDSLKELFNRLFMRHHPTGAVPDKRKIGLIIFLLVGGLFIFAFFFSTAPKKKAEGGGVGVAVAGQLAPDKAEVKGENAPVVSVQPRTQGTSRSGSGGEAASGISGSASAAAGTSGSALASSGDLGAPLTQEGSSSTSSAGANGGVLPPPPSTPGGGTQSIPSPPPPPPPVYGSFGTSSPPPDPSLAASGAASGPAAPPMVLYASPGVSAASPSASPQTPSAPASGPAPEPSSSGYALPGGMYVYSIPSGGMMVVASPPSPVGMTAASQTPPESSGQEVPPLLPPTPGMPGGNR